MVIDLREEPRCETEALILASCTRPAQGRSRNSSVSRTTWQPIEAPGQGGFFYTQYDFVLVAWCDNHVLYEVSPGIPSPHLAPYLQVTDNTPYAVLYIPVTVL